VELENTSAARSLITDTDIGQETAALVRAKLMQDASLYTQQMAAQRQSEVVLDLLKSAAAPTVNVRIQLT
jgi:flagellin-like hook-associated protein FlgL